ncbi:tyrosine protein phosphatase [Bacillaceae bacterium Marseille-Q3522]|nr:tyrosine protein phosphatase [Bacillaceae bacterium Marseille-Q3522]
MIDLHCHILENVDDGPATVTESIEMAKAALNDGIKTIVATPHHMNSRYENPRADVLTAVEQLNQRLQDESLPLTILPGQEIRLYGEILEDYAKGNLLTLNNSDYMFIEFPSNHVPRYAEKLLYDIQLQGLIPIIVHPERNKEVQEQPDILYQLIKRGALSQVTAASVAGDFGKKVKQFSLQLIEANLTHFVASDAHNTYNRTFRMTAAFKTIEEQFGVDYTYLFTENSNLLIDHQHIYKEPPERIKKKKFLGLF